MAYGLPYCGSKNRIAKRLVDLLPAGGTFYDVFCGGCAMTHAAMLSGKWSRFIANDLHAEVPQFFADAIAGRFAGRTQWVDREDFFRTRATDMFTRFVFSFGNAGAEYLYAAEVEPYKRAMHEAYYGNDDQFRDIFPALPYGLTGESLVAFTKANAPAIRSAYIAWLLRQAIGPGATMKAARERFAAISADLEDESEELRLYLRNALTASGLTQADIDRATGTQMSGHYFGRSQWCFPTVEAYSALRKLMPALTLSYDEATARLSDLKKKAELGAVIAYAEDDSPGALSMVWRIDTAARWKRINSLRGLDRFDLTVKADSYERLAFDGPGVIYCDIPYKGTENPYGGGAFDHERFYDWAEVQLLPVFISEYWMPPDRFRCVCEIPLKCTYSGSSNRLDRIERLFVPVHQAGAVTLFDMP